MITSGGTTTLGLYDFKIGIEQFGQTGYWVQKANGYPINKRIMLTNGDIVKSTVNGNTNDPNVNMTGWVNPKLEQEKKNNETVSTADYGSVGKAQNIPVSDWYTIGSANFRGYANLAAVQVDYPHVLSATNTVDWAAAQKACDVQKKHGAIKIVGCLFFKQGETLSTKVGQRLYGLNSGWFANTNDGTAFTGSLTGGLPEYGIYYDGTTGTALSCEAATQLEGFHLFGKGLTLTDGSVNILDIKDAAFYDTIGVEIKKSITTNNFSVYYFGTAFKTIGGNYYSRFNTTEVTRCSTAYKYSVTTYNQDFYGCVIRNTREPFLFDAGVACPNFSFFGGSIEGFRPQVSKDYAIGVPANSSMQFIGTYFENLDTDGVFESAFGFLGGNTEIRFLGCMIYLNHFNNWVKQSAFNKITVSSKNNRFFLSNGSRSKNPIIYNVIFIQNSSYLDVDGSDRINFPLSVPYSTKTGSITSGSTSLTLNDVTDVYVGQRIRIASPEFQTVVKSIVGNVVTLQTAPTFSHNGSVEIYLTPQYVSFGIGSGLLNNDLIYPRDYLASFDSLEFRHVSGIATKSLTKAPSNPFGGGNNGVSTYVADYANWNPSGKSDGRGAYPTVYRGGKYFPQLGSFAGSFTFATGTAFTVLDTNVASSSKIMLMPTNSAAATLLKNGMYVSVKANNTSFTVTALTAAVGTETFDYTITD